MSALKKKPGRDTGFPWLSENQRFRFPDPLRSTGDVIASGGNLSPGMLLSAYEQGLFPWYNPWEPILWQSPDPRFVIFPENLHISASMEKILRREDFEIRYNSNFPAVIHACAAIRQETWITDDMIAAYIELHRLGYAHSAESYVAGELVGACYGLLLGRAFFGESMFARRSNASKAAFLSLAGRLFSGGLAFIDCQVPSSHMESLGGQELSRAEFLKLLKRTALSGYHQAWLHSSQNE